MSNDGRSQLHRLEWDFRGHAAAPDSAERLCRDHLADGTQPIPIEQYKGIGQTWNYSNNP